MANGSLDKIVAIYDVETKEFDKEINKVQKEWAETEKVSKKSIDQTNKNLKEQAGIVEKVRNRIKKLETARDKANDPRALKGYNEQLKRNRELLKRLTGEQKKQVTQTDKLAKSFNRMGAAVLSLYRLLRLFQPVP